MICEKCNQEHDGKYGSGRFCSVICARGFSRKLPQEEINRRESLGLIAARTPEARAKAVATAKRNKEVAKAKRIAEGNWDDLSFKDRKARVLIEQNNLCLECGIGREWNGKPLNLHYDHIDGENTNNVRSNIRCICPNCHSQTETYAGRNKKLKRQKS